MPDPGSDYAAARPPSQDAGQPEFWETRYRKAVMPWDTGKVPADFATWVVNAQPCRIMIPGCGSAYEAGLLAERGWDVTAIDFSPAAIEAAQKVLGPYAAVVRLADFFDFPAAPFDAVYERAFLCALPPAMRNAYARRMAELVKPGGQLFGYFFVAPPPPSGPPFSMPDEALQALLGGAFVRTADRGVEDSLPVFGGNERWQVWQRR